MLGAGFLVEKDRLFLARVHPCVIPLSWPLAARSQAIWPKMSCLHAFRLAIRDERFPTATTCRRRAVHAPKGKKIMVGPKVLNLLGFAVRDRVGFGAIFKTLSYGCFKSIHQYLRRDVSF